MQSFEYQLFSYFKCFHKKNGTLYRIFVTFYNQTQPKLKLTFAYALLDRPGCSSSLALAKASPPVRHPSAENEKT